MARLIYGFDALCGWCYGFVPAMRRLVQDHPDIAVEPVFPGLVTGDRVGPYAAMEGYIRGASARLQAVTGRAPSAAFFRLIQTPGVKGDSGPPTAVLAYVKAQQPDRLLSLCHATIEAHFQDGADLNQPRTYANLFDRLRIDLPVPPLTDAAAIRAAQTDGRRHGITQFPTLILDGTVLPTTYDPAELSDLVGAIRAQAV